jgi:photosystem II stability/assembly factor-like uncharacterized protein
VRAAVAALASVAALIPPAAAGAVPKAPWYWTLAVAPADASTLLLGTGSGLYRSSDGGRTWRAAGLGTVNVTSIAASGGALYLGGVRRRPGVKPVIVAGGAYISGPGTTVLEVSRDGGATWTGLRPRGLPDVGVQALAVDPGGTSLYAVVRNGGLFRSDDGGGSFRPVAPLVGGTPWAVAVTANHRFLSGDMTSGAYVSTTGKRWQRTSFADPQGGSMVMEYAVQPNAPLHVLMTSYGVLTSANGGATWHVVLRSKVMFGPVAWAPHETSVAYAVGWDRSVWRSGNGGASWSRVS